MLLVPEITLESQYRDAIEELYQAEVALDIVNPDDFDLAYQRYQLAVARVGHLNKLLKESK